MASLIPVTTTRIGEHLPLLDLLPAHAPLSWVRNGEGLVGWGVHATTKVSGRNRFEDARDWWHHQLETFAVANSVHGSGTGPVLFTSFSFDRNEESVLVIPKVVVGQKGSQSWITWIGDSPQPVLPESPAEFSQGTFIFSDGSISTDAWKERVAEAIKRIDSSQVDKVVLARDLVATSTQEIEAIPVLKKLATEYPSTWTFAVDGLVGATPELLLRLSRGMVTSRVLAGTIPKTGDDEKDLALAASLARSSKDLEEHEYAVRSVAEALEPFCSSTNVPESPFVLHLANVMHLATDVTGALIETKQRVDAFSLLKSLHPSAAVCGTPRNIAFDIIDEIEGMNRGRYAGPVGWIDASGDGELGIALRTGQITGKEIRIYAGCGIVAGSNPEKELEESAAKMIPMRSALHA
ncbi:menaquinone-specific isochorismate synthase [Candidatus Planktophila sulfonica]|uniref:isochorismate synthase n=1 Tax=Candidatus Planktophila sulfonica TaxID=1884904 RepID=A0A249KHY9_9ACTN|nr:isochorismate synthase [Candidatus Planktophila sulfonica]ASY16420.1 menaquinone-specific isochorismate synthase [Candidatus Planktophila sulfonica]